MHAITTRERRKFMPVDLITWTQPLASHIFPSSFRRRRRGENTKWIDHIPFPILFFLPKIVDRSISSAGAFVICNPQVFFGVSKGKADFVLFSLRLPRKETGNEKEKSWFETVSPRNRGREKKTGQSFIKTRGFFFPRLVHFDFKFLLFPFLRERKVCVYVSWCRHFALSFLPRPPIPLSRMKTINIPISLFPPQPFSRSRKGEGIINSNAREEKNSWKCGKTVARKKT